MTESKPVPDWVTSGPDRDGNRSGPTLTPAECPITVSLAWMAPGEAMLWMDTVRYDDGPLTNREAIEVASGLLQGVLLGGGSE